MEDKHKTKIDRTTELADMRRQVSELQTLTAEQKQMLETVRARQTHFAMILDIASEAVISVDERQQIIFFNKGAEQIFGYAIDEVIGQPLDILLPERFVRPHRDYIGDFARSKTTTRLMGERQEIHGRRKNGEEFPAEASISRIEQDGQQIFTIILRDITERKQIEQEREKLVSELKALSAGARAITAELSVEQVLQKITQTAQKLINVKYAALGIHDGHGRLSRFITTGIEPADHAKIGPLPVGRGLIGYLLQHGQSIIVNDIAQHQASIGFPENHPIMHSLLGVPIRSKSDLIGALYLTDKQNGASFTETDLQLVEMLALQAAIAIENARLYEQTERLAILEERERFARDLHDGIIQSIYAVGLALDQVKLDIPPTDQVTQAQIDGSLKRLASVIQEIRNYIFDLRPHALKYRGLKARLEGLIKELRVNTLLPIRAEIAEDIDTHLSDIQASHVFHICHEALANTARHAKATQISVHLLKEDGLIKLQVEDNGVGFEFDPQVNPGHRGLANILSRAAQLNANLEIISAPHQGTRLILTLQDNRH